MLSFFRRQKLDPVKTALKLINKGEKYAVTRDNIETLYTAMAKLRENVPNDVAYREQYVDLYRPLKEFTDTVNRINEILSEHQAVVENYNLKQALTRYKLDEWLVDHEKRRADYYAFIDVLIPSVVEHLLLLDQLKKGMNKNQYQGMLLSLYTVHCDMLSIAEVHLRYFSQR